MLICSFDLETTGVDVTTARIVTAACIDVDTATNAKTDYNWVADPGVEIPAEAAAVHGWTTERARAEGQDHDKVVNELISHIYDAWNAGAYLVVYNAAYDLSLLHVLSGGTFEIRGPVIDPLVLDKHFDKYRRGNRKLITVATHYGFTFSEEEAHAADADAVMAALVADSMKNNVYASQFPQSTSDLMKLQMDAKAEQTRSLRAYFEKQGKPFDGDEGWPIQFAALNKVGTSSSTTYKW